MSFDGHFCLHLLALTRSPSPPSSVEFKFMKNTKAEHGQITRKSPTFFYLTSLQIHLKVHLFNKRGFIVIFPINYNI